MQATARQSSVLGLLRLPGDGRHTMVGFYRKVGTSVESDGNKDIYRFSLECVDEWKEHSWLGKILVDLPIAEIAPLGSPGNSSGHPDADRIVSG
jgi:hypothetical protein